MSVTLNPIDAAARHLRQGELARVVSETGQLVLPVEVSDDVPLAVALVPKGRWPKLEPSGANVNLRTQATKPTWARARRCMDRSDRRGSTGLG